MTGFQPRKYRYKTSVEWSKDNKGEVNSEDKPSIEIALPVELGGPGGIWSPDELFVSSIEACAMLTFFWLIDGKGLDVISYKSEAEGVSQIADDGKFRFTEVILKPIIKISNNDDRPKVEGALKKLDDWCCVSNSTKASVLIKPEIIVVNNNKSRDQK